MKPDFPEAYIPNAPWRKRFSKWFGWVKINPFVFSVGAAVTAGVVALIWFIVWMAYPREVVTTVDDISWMYITNLRQKETRQGSGWGHQGTRGFYKEPVFNERCESRYYGEETYICGWYTTTYDCGNNTTCQTVNYVYCNRPVYKTWCDYSYFEWPVIDTIQKFGSTHEVVWGEFNVKGLHQRIQKISSYEVNFKTIDDGWQYKPGDLEDFKRFNPGDKWKLQVGRIRRHNIEKMTKL